MPDNTIRRLISSITPAGLGRLAACAVLVLGIYALCDTGPAAAADTLPGEEPELVNPHNFMVRDYCKICHGTDTSKLSFDPVTTCTRCHEGNVANHPVSRHPIGKATKIYIPGSLPLTKDGRMVCYTCHEPHNKSQYQKMLRIPYFKLCATCHAGY